MKIMPIACLKSAVTAAVAIAAMGSAHAAKITLSFADHSAPTHYLSAEGSAYFMKRATEITNGEIEWRYFPAEQIAKAAGILKAVESGRIDAALLVSQYVSDRLPLNGVGALPGLIQNTSQGTEAYWSLVEEADSPLRKEFINNGVVPLGTFLLPPYQLMTGSAPLESLDGLRGLKIRTSGGSQDLALRGLGAVPVQVPAPDLYMALDRGIVDGAVFSFLSARGWKIGEVIKSASTNANLASVPMALIVNKRKYESLPANIQKALAEAGEDTIRHISRYMDEDEKKAAAEFKAAGVVVYELSPETLAEVKKGLELAYQDWVGRLEKRNLPASAVLEAFQNAVKAVKGE